MKTETMTELRAPSTEELLVVEIITCWLLSRTAEAALPRVNFRLVFGDERIARLTRAALADDEGPRDGGLPPRRFFVRTSADPDAVRLRHGRPEGVAPDASVVYGLFWTPSLDFHASRMANAVGADHGGFPEQIGGIVAGFVMGF